MMGVHALNARVVDVETSAILSGTAKSWSGPESPITDLAKYIVSMYKKYNTDGKRVKVSWSQRDFEGVDRVDATLEQQKIAEEALIELDQTWY